MSTEDELAQDGQPVSSDPGSRNSAGSLDRITAVELTAFSGPLPHPDILGQYEAIHPGAAKQIFDDFLQESQHRRRLERKVVAAETFGDITGALSSATIGILGVGGGLWLLHEGRSLAGLSSVIATLASLLSVYLYQQRKGPDERNPKS